jgi:catechol 2,3-dioxygenase-like lactoylglutathione lyase family enzyme
VPEIELARITRRCVLRSLGALAAAPGWARAAETSRAAVAPLGLPLELRQIVNHIGISVPDVVASARFYSHLFDGPKIVGQTTPALRYSISFYPGAMAIGGLKTSGTGESGDSASASGSQRAFIDHFCVAAVPFDLAAWRDRLGEEGLRFFARGTFVDVAGIPVQLLGGHEPGPRPESPGPAGPQAPKGAADGGFHPMPPLYAGRPLVEAHGFEYVSLHVPDVEEAAALFGKLFGLTPQRVPHGGIAFRLGATALRLGKAASAEKPRIASYAIRVSKFDRARLTDELRALGAAVKSRPEHEDRAVLRFADPDGIECELRA